MIRHTALHQSPDPCPQHHHGCVAVAQREAYAAQLDWGSRPSDTVDLIMGKHSVLPLTCEVMTSVLPASHDSEDAERTCGEHRGQRQSELAAFAPSSVSSQAGGHAHTSRDAKRELIDFLQGSMKSNVSHAEEPHVSDCTPRYSLESSLAMRLSLASAKLAASVNPQAVPFAFGAVSSIFNPATVRRHTGLT